MPYRRVIFVNNSYYHICNRSVGSEHIFDLNTEVNRALKLINFYRFDTGISFSGLSKLSSTIRELRIRKILNSPPLVEILSFSLMSTHFHFVVRQIVDNGIITFLTNFQNSYAKYFNIKHKRHGALFTNRFKAIYIESEEQLFHVIRYVELNPVTGFICEIDDLVDYPTTSFTTYMGKIVHPFVSTEVVLNRFKNPANYKQFIFDQSDYQRKLQRIKKLMLEN